MKTMKHRAMLAQAICDEGLRRIAEAAAEAGLPELAWQAEMERLELLRSRLRAVRPSLAAWAPEDTEGLWRAVRLARSGPYE